MLQFALIVPTFNLGARWAEWLEALHRQSVTPSRVLIVDSESDDGHLSITDDPASSASTLHVQPSITAVRVSRRSSGLLRGWMLS